MGICNININLVGRELKNLLPDEICKQFLPCLYILIKLRILVSVCVCCVQYLTISELIVTKLSGMISLGPRQGVSYVELVNIWRHCIKMLHEFERGVCLLCIQSFLTDWDETFRNGQFLIWSDLKL